MEKQSLLWPNWFHSTVSGEDLDLYVKRFHERALDCCDAVDGETMVEVC